MASENEQEKRETLADIVSDMREAGALMPAAYMRDLLNYAERIEAIDSADAWRSLYTPGNAAAMREALLRCEAISCLPEIREQQCVRDMRNIIADALSAPPRQCDVGTAGEQMKRFDEFTSKYWPLGMSALQWAQTPYEAQEGAGE